MCFLHGAWKGERCAHRKGYFQARGGSAPGKDTVGLCNKNNFFVLFLKSCKSPFPVYPPV